MVTCQSILTEPLSLVANLANNKIASVACTTVDLLEIREIRGAVVEAEIREIRGAGAVVEAGIREIRGIREAGVAAEVAFREIRGIREVLVGVVAGTLGAVVVAGILPIVNWFSLIDIFA